MFVFVRAVTYATLFIGLVLVYVPAQLVSWPGLTRPVAMGALQIVGVVIGVVGSLVALWCIFTFASVGRGTPAPFDPPRRLVIQGPYRFVRNPMYIGAGVALFGAALIYRSVPLLAYAGLFFVTLHFFVIWYEEPTLRRTFGLDYEAYCDRIGRWWPRI